MPSIRIVHRYCTITCVFSINIYPHASYAPVFSISVDTEMPTEKSNTIQCCVTNSATGLWIALDPLFLDSVYFFWPSGCKCSFARQFGRLSFLLVILNAPIVRFTLWTCSCHIRLVVIKNIFEGPEETLRKVSYINMPIKLWLPYR